MVLDGTGSVYDDTGWYLVSISWYCLILGGTWSAKGLYACIYWKKWRFGRVLPMPHRQQNIELLSFSPVSSLRRGVRSDAQLSSTETRFQKCSQSGKNGSKHPMLSISMAYNVISCKKVERNTQKLKIADFTM